MPVTVPPEGSGSSESPQSPSTPRTQLELDGGRPRRPVLVRILVPLVLVLVWLGVTAFGGQTFGQISDVVSNDQSTFLPVDAESTQATEYQQQFSDEDAVPATVIAASDGELTPDQLAEAESAAEDFEEVTGAVQVIGPQPSEDGEAVQILVLLEELAVDEGDAIVELKELTSEAFSSSEWTAHVTGPAALSDDLSEAFAGIDGLLLLVAVVAVFIILVVVYRSVILPVLVLLSSVAALSAAILVIYQMALNDWIQLNGQAQGILSILVIGAATDYSLLLVARYREELLLRRNRYTALLTAVRRAAPAILASGGTVAVALLCLLFSELNSNRGLGPVTSTGIVFSMIATLTFLPALLALFGRPVFWPKIPRVTEQSVTQLTAAQPAVSEQAAQTAEDTAEPVDGESSTSSASQAQGWARVAGWVRRRPRPIWIVVTLLLILAAAGATDLRASGVPQSDLVLGETETKQGQELLEEHFDAGTGSPADIFTAADQAAQTLEIVEDAEGVGEAFLVDDSGAPAQEPEDAQEIDGIVEISATLTDPGDSLAAEETIRELRADLEGLEGEVVVGGTTATQLDTNETAQRDLVTIVPIVLAAIGIILVLLLRSLVTPLILIATTVLSYLSALGISALVFNYAFGFPGADATVPLFGFMFLVALGVDYNIFLMTRAREEAHRLGAREGLLRSLVATGGVITSAGIVLAATFSALAVLPLMFMVQLAFLVALGVFIDTFVVRTLQVPAMGVDIGRRIWWPSALGRGRD
ncbi:MMPL family transporter [Nesterenkonia aerolata]|uniref:MMPL family transporter n=1 Tax=Nesterenkonia aerolata TaxID=3074079 RepID=A0ABU2DSZ6_9MICC|nr:MMPL family transporter [Nesterenkonia sp. LY-0111]MDR8019629.1 MMPL family transporter [Nesterenkonia sp. LY-0111]